MPEGRQTFTMPKKGKKVKQVRVVVAARAAPAPKPKKKKAKANRGNMSVMPYARLLSDPCNAPLVQPLYEGYDGGYMIRFESFHTWNASAGATSGYFMYTPGAIGPNNIDLIGGEGATSSTAIAAAAYGNQLGGRTFLQGSAASVRVAAACMEITYSGSEQSRAGRIHYGQVQGSVLDVGDSRTPDQVAAILPYYERTPATVTSLALRVGAWDGNFTDPNVSTVGSNKDKNAALAFAWVGLPTSVAITVKITCVYQWQPVVSSGIANSSMPQSRTGGGTLSQVLQYLDSLSKNPWVRSAADNLVTNFANMNMRGMNNPRLTYR